MIKALFFSAALLALGIAAYAANPTANLSVQIVPAASGSVPGPAAAAGFTTLALDEDFSQPFYSNPAAWLDCAGASSPLWYYAWAGFGPGPYDAPCSAILQQTDPLSGQPALLMYWQDGFFNPAHVSYAMIQTVDSTNGPNGAGRHFPPNAYFEVTGRYDTPATNATMDFWSYTTAVGGMEWDGIEAYTGPNDAGSTIHNGSLANGWNTAAGLDLTQYHRYAWRVTSDGSTHSNFCVYIDDVFKGCIDDGFSGNQYTMPTTLQFLVGMSCRGVGTPCTNGRQINIWVSKAKVWSCAGPNSGANCFTGNPNP